MEGLGCIGWLPGSATPPRALLAGLLGAEEGMRRWVRAAGLARVLSCGVGGVGVVLLVLISGCFVGVFVMEVFFGWHVFINVYIHVYVCVYMCTCACPVQPHTQHTQITPQTPPPNITHHAFPPSLYTLTHGYIRDQLLTTQLLPCKGTCIIAPSKPPFQFRALIGDTCGYDDWIMHHLCWGCVGVVLRLCWGCVDFMVIAGVGDV